MSTFILARDSILPWERILSNLGPGQARVANDTSLILDGRTLTWPALSFTLEFHGSGFGPSGTGLLSGTGEVNSISLTANGLSILRIDGARLAGPDLAAWMKGDGIAFERGILSGSDYISLSNGSEIQDGLGGNDTMHGWGGDDTLRGDAGDDILYGDSGSDYLLGSDGRDTLIGGTGQDLADGGAGHDSFITAALRRQVQVTRSADLLLSGPEGQDTLRDIEEIIFADGALHLDPGGTAGQVWRLYGAALGRTPDAIGLADWVRALDSGAITLSGVAAGFVGSPEFLQRFGHLDDAGYVSLLYANVLGRSPDAGGLQNWLSALAGGMSRTDVLLGFSESSEFRMGTAAATASGIWVVDAEAVDVLRCYMTVLDRLPDAGGLANWTAAHAGGLGLADMAAGFIGSAEFQSRFGTLSNQDFVAQMYLSALDRAADPAGLASWTQALDSGALDRQDVVLGFAYSHEMTVKLVPLVSDGITFA